VKLNHNEFLSYPNAYDQIMFSSVQRAWEWARPGVGATIYFGSDESRRQIVEVARAFEEAHRPRHVHRPLVLHAQLAFKIGRHRLPLAADLTGQANHLGVTIEADIIKQKLPESNGGFNVLAKDKPYGKTSKLVYSELTSDNPIDLTRYQVANCYMGRSGLINSGGASSGETDLAEAVRTAVVNKRAGGMGLISGRKSFQRPMPRASRCSTRSRTSTSPPRSRSRSPAREAARGARGFEQELQRRVQGDRAAA
jgi:class I fructose-bisphosphate aldolase